MNCCNSTNVGQEMKPIDGVKIIKHSGYYYSAARTNAPGGQIVSEQHYGCYRFGLIVAVIIIILLIVCAVVPIFLATDDAKVILMGVLIALFIVSILVFCYIGWEQRRAARQRLKARLQRDEMKDQEMSNMRRVAASGHSASQSSWLFVSEKPNDYYKTRTSSPPPVYTTV